MIMRPANQDPMPKYGCVTAFRGRPAIGIKPRIARSIRILERYGLQEREREREKERETDIEREGETDTGKQTERRSPNGHDVVSITPIWKKWTRTTA